jgi:uncharacterized membrane protein
MAAENDAKTVREDDKKFQIWNSLLKASLRIPGAKVDRSAFFRSQLETRVDIKTIEKAIRTRPALAGISEDEIDEIANGCIGKHVIEVSGISFLTGLPGGWWAAGTIPADLAQFYWHALVLCQKLAYLYGWPSLLEKDEKIDDEIMLRLTLFIGVMMGASGATDVVSKFSEHFSTEVAPRLPRAALTKVGIYNLAKQVGKWIGIQITKTSFSRVLSKIIPVLGGVISAGISAGMMIPMANRLRDHLKTLKFAKKAQPRSRKVKKT